MKATLQSLRIENFKGTKSYFVEFDGNDADILGATGTGKTTEKDAVVWLWTGKDASGRSASGKSSFGIRPVDAKNNPIPDIITVVEAVYDFDGDRHTLRKAHKEKIVKGELDGYDTECWIDAVPYKSTDFASWLASKVPAKEFRLLTDLRYFNEQMKWQDRRSILLQMAGDISKPDFPELNEALNGRTVDQYKTVLQQQKNQTEKDQETNKTRIDENQHKLNEYSGGSDDEAMRLKRDSLESVISKLDDKRKDIIGQQREREILKEGIDKIRTGMAEREIALARDTSGIQHLLNQKTEIQTKLGILRQGVQEAQGMINSKTIAESNHQNAVQAQLDNLNRAREDYAAIKAEIGEIQNEMAEIGEAKLSEEDTACYACGQTLPADKLEELKTKMQAKLDEKKATLQKRLEQKEKRRQEIKAQGNKANTAIQTKKKDLESTQEELVELKEALETAKNHLVVAEEQAENTLAVIDSQIAQNPTTPPAKDPKWCELQNQLLTASKELGEPVSDQLEQLDADREAKQKILNQVNEALAASDEIVKATKRIEELSQKNQDLAQNLADIQKMLDMIDAYKEEESRLIEAAVNDKFKLVTWKLFGKFINGNGDPCCVALLNGNPYPDCSTGERIMINNDCANVLSEHYGHSVPRFFDDVVLVTEELPTDCQSIKLITDESVKELKVNVKGQESEVSNAA